MSDQAGSEIPGVEASHLTPEPLSHDEYLRKRAILCEAIEAARAAYRERQIRPHLEAFWRAQKEIETLDEAQAPPPPESPPRSRSDTYRGEHQAPMNDCGSPLFDVAKNGTYPPDFYAGRAHEYLSDEAERQALGIVLGARNRPNMSVTVYRAVPKGVPRKINVGDWATPIRSYAVAHGRDLLRNDHHIVQKLVFARDIFTAGDSLLEWGLTAAVRKSDQT